MSKTDIAKFNFEIEPEQPKWIVESLLPAGQLCIFLAQAGVGKSLLVEDLAIHIVYGEPFGNFVTVEGDVLVIDQDTPTDILTRRFIQFGKGINHKGIEHKKKYDLYVESMKGYSLADGTLMSVIKEYPTVKLVLIDSLHSVCGRLNPNYTSDMNMLAKLKEHCLTNDKTIIINHHISEKMALSIDELMTSNSHIMAMGNSAIIQQADSYYIIGAISENGKTSKLYLRPVAKRISIKSTPIVLQIVKPGEDSERFEYIGEYTPDLTGAESDMLVFFREQPQDRTVKEAYEGIGHHHGEKVIRQSLAGLADKGLLVLSRHKSNLFRYRLP